MNLPILHDAGGVLAVAKPAGLATQAPAGIPSVESVMRERLFGAAFTSARSGGHRRHPGGFLGVPHRLDRAVSGVLLLATTPRAARQLSRQFERREIRKTYLAVVAPAATDTPHGDGSFEWRDTIRKVPDEPRAEIVPAGSADGREAVTIGRVLPAGDTQPLPDTATLLVELEPLTGRMHQLRAQSASRGLPVVGDTLYGGRPLGDADSEAIALHAWRITFRDPATADEVTITCPPPSRPPWHSPSLS
ncbi:MAG: RluA family pseudouridine synthase [Planctomycetota bacterium]